MFSFVEGILLPNVFNEPAMMEMLRKERLEGFGQGDREVLLSRLLSKRWVSEGNSARRATGHHSTNVPYIHAGAIVKSERLTS